MGTDQDMSAISLQQEQIVWGTRDGNATFWHIPNNLKAESGQKFQCYPEAVSDLVINQAGTRLLSVNGESQFKSWDVEQKKELAVEVFATHDLWRLL